MHASHVFSHFGNPMQKNRHPHTKGGVGTKDVNVNMCMVKGCAAAAGMPSQMPSSPSDSPLSPRTPHPTLPTEAATLTGDAKHDAQLRYELRMCHYCSLLCGLSGTRIIISARVSQGRSSILTIRAFGCKIPVHTFELQTISKQPTAFGAGPASGAVLDNSASACCQAFQGLQTTVETVQSFVHLLSSWSSHHHAWRTLLRTRAACTSILRMFQVAQAG